MKQVVMKKWVKALRSGRYKQGSHTLDRRFKNGRHRYCCLGVLAKLAEEEEGIEVKRCGDKPDLISGVTLIDQMPVLEWSGLKTDTGMVQLKDPGGHQVSTCLTDLNDGTEDGRGPNKPKTFSEIADIIEKNWRKL